MLHHFYCKVGKTVCTIFSCILGHTEEKKMAATLLTAAFKPFGRNRWMRNIINDGVEASARKSQPRFQIIQASSTAEPRMRLEKSENLPEISCLGLNPIIDSIILFESAPEGKSDQKSPRYIITGSKRKTFLQWICEV